MPLINRLGCAVPAALTLAVFGVGATFVTQSIDFRWSVHDPERPKPAVVHAPATAAPSDAVVLLGAGVPGADAWRGGTGDAAWGVDDGVMTVAPGTGAIYTRQEFGDCQLHLEWRFPVGREMHGQMGGNSGVFFMNRYEVQILHTHGNESYADGMAGAIYGQYPPLVNPCRPAGEWNTYDIVFRAPRFDADGNVESPATVTAFFNGVLVQDAVELLGTTAHQRRAAYAAHGPTGPIQLQDHGDPISFRNIWVRPLPERRGPE